MSNIRYNNLYCEKNVYGHVVNLIKNHGVKDGIHLDFGAGFGAIAEPLRDIGLEYIGLDLEKEGNDSLTKRGFQALQINLSDLEESFQKITQLLNKKRLSSISLIDVLEHLTNGHEVLSFLNKIAAKFNALLVISVPNISHADISFKLLVGKFDYTETGLLDKTHVFFYTNQTLKQMTSSAGWSEIDHKDIIQSISDQHFPSDHLVLQEATLFMHYIKMIKQMADPYYKTYQFVRAYLPKILVNKDIEFKRLPNENFAFLSVIIRTQAERLTTLRDVFLCLAAQTSQDFEIILAAHKVSISQQIDLERIIEEQPTYIRQKTQLLLVNNDESRAAPLNRGIEIAKGRYVSALDDDDLVFAHWVENFHTMSQKETGRVLRAVTVTQDIDAILTSPSDALQFKTIGGIKVAYPHQFHLIEHLIMNHTPFMSWSFPISLFRDFNFRFDESLNTCEDWDLAMRAVLFCGCVDDPKVTSIYRKWISGSCSRTLHKNNEWEDCHQRISIKLTANQQVLSSKYLKELISLKTHNADLQNQVQYLQNQVQYLQNYHLKLKSLHKKRSGLFLQKLGKFLQYEKIMARSALLHKLRKNILNKKAIKTCKKSSFFDINWYVNRYPDVEKSGIDPVAHYVKYGASEGRDPGPYFSTTAYYHNHPEIHKMGINPLFDFEKGQM